MLVRLRHGPSQWLVSGGYLLLLLFGAQIESPAGWRATAAAVAALALVAWVLALRRARAVADTPTSTIASAAQGYVELLGRGRPAGAPLVAPLNQLPCLWYRYRVERKQNDKWVTEESGESTESFQIDDGTGRCLVDPEGAEILPRGTETWQRDDRRYTQALLIEGEPIYALGSFRTLNGDGLDLSVAEDVKQLLADWKRDVPKLLVRFDRNGDGVIDLHEWELARAAARREVERNHRELRTAPDTHLLGKPADGRLFLISSLPPAQIERRFVLWALAHAAVFLAGLAGSGYSWAI